MILEKAEDWAEAQKYDYTVSGLAEGDTWETEPQLTCLITQDDIYKPATYAITVTAGKIDGLPVLRLRLLPGGAVAGHAYHCGVIVGDIVHPAFFAGAGSARERRDTCALPFPRPMAAGSCLKTGFQGDISLRNRQNRGMIGKL